MTDSTSLELTGTEVHVWRTSLNVSDEVVRSLESLLSEDEQLRASRFAFERIRRRFVVRRGQLRSVLARYLNQNPRELRFEYGLQDKPRLVAEPAWETLSFNTTHSYDMALFAVAHRREVGIDLEKIRDDFEPAEIANRHFAASEAAALEAAPLESRLPLFFDFWTCKEAWIKAMGGGLSIPLNQFEIRLEPGKSPARVVSLGLPIVGPQWFVHRLRIAPGYAAALAVAGCDVGILLRDWAPPASG